MFNIQDTLDKKKKGKKNTREGFMALNTAHLLQ
jgi:hypothetical protein